MSLTRRTFLKVIGASAVATALPLNHVLAFVKQEQKPVTRFNRNLEYGNAVPVTSYNLPQDAWKSIYKLLINNMRKKLPRGTRFELRAKIPSDYGRHLAVAWYYHPKFNNVAWRRFIKPLSKDWIVDTRHGFMVIGRGIV